MTHAARFAQAPTSGQPAQPPPYRPEEAAQLLGVSRITVQRHFAALGGVKLGSAVLIPRARVDELAGLPAVELPAVERIAALLPLLDRDGVYRVLAAVARRIAEETGR